MDKTYTIKQASEALKVPSRTLKYFCDHNLIVPSQQSANGYRLITATQFELIKVLNGLFVCGCDINDLQKYVLLQRNSEQDEAERIAFLQTKKRQAWQKIEDLQSTIGIIERQEELSEKSN